ncbi:hypothetical protein PaeCFBP13512_08740 [Paenibacillus sp. CFBP13512]|uniref:WapI family immunity protein n=1 Tax=Paenibacillus sp. CFBP13512 TaxID=2184007 RepID=UPI0010C0F5F0|nr:hypothetical protein [Paenibacillus sp. CFBP13512]TKJ91420.1 hypothetical protein PaeCFBP13512_08740 [Paenibacillus sp. CFBP13512]
MLWISRNIRFELNILHYDYPLERVECLYDDWLTVQLIAQDENGLQWEASSSCMFAKELQDLRDWFGSIRVQNVVWQTFFFMEPELSFTYIPNGTVEIGISQSFYPKALMEHGRQTVEKSLIMELPEDVLYDLIQQLDHMIVEFPQRSTKQ